MDRQQIIERQRFLAEHHAEKVDTAERTEELADA